jgi:hypothetical protein
MFDSTCLNAFSVLFFVLVPRSRPFAQVGCCIEPVASHACHARMCITNPKSCETSCGKSMLAHAAADAAGINVITVTLPPPSSSSSYSKPWAAAVRRAQASCCTASA